MIALAAGFAAGWLLASRSRTSNEAQLREAFQALAATTLKTTTDEFLKLADQKIGNVHREATIDLTRRQQELGTLVTPIKDTLQQVDAKLKEVEKTRIDDSASMRSMLGLVGHTQQQLQQETQNLVRALRSPGVRGQWGEVQLRKVVELSGMLEHCDFDQQPTIFTESGRLRPDMTINLPGGRTHRRRCEGAARGVPRRAGGDGRRRAQRQAGRPRAAGEGSRDEARRQGVLGRAALFTGARGAVPAGRGDLHGGARAGFAR